MDGYELVKWPQWLVGVKRVVFQHYRVPNEMHWWLGLKGEPAPEYLYHYRKGVDTWTPAQRGGRTVCVLDLDDGRRLIGEAVCSLSDPFDYSRGRDLSYTRALYEAGLIS